MADDRWLQWQAEYAGTNRLPSIWSTFALFAVVAAVLLALLYQPTTATADSGRRVAPTTGVPACAQHFPPTCKRR